MKIRRVVAANLAVVIIGVSLTVAPAFADKSMTAQAGQFMGIGNHNAAGKVAVTKDKKGAMMLTMTDMKVDKVPDGRVYLANDLDYAEGVELGKLTKFTGTVTFPIPASVDPAKYNSVVIWCKKFDVGIGQAKLH